MQKSRRRQIILAPILIIILLTGCSAGNQPATVPAGSTPAAAADTQTDPGGPTVPDRAESSAQLPPETTVPDPAETTAWIPPESSEVPPASSEVPETSAPPVTETPLGEDVIENPDGSRLIRRYDPDGRLVEEIRTAADGTQLSVKKFVYYPGGSTVKWAFEETRKADGSFLSSSETGYYENGQIKSREEQAADGTSDLTQYDENGRETLQEKRNKDGVRISSVTHTYYADGTCASRITEKRNDQSGIKGRTSETFYEDGVLSSVEKILSDGRRQRTQYNEKGIRTLFEEYDESGTLRVRDSWEFYENGKVYRTVEEAWKQDGSVKSRVDTRYSTYDALFDRRTISEDQPDRELYESFDDSNRLLYKEITMLDGTFIRSFETVYYFRSNQVETEEEIWMEGDARRSVKRTYDSDGTLRQDFEQFADGSTLTQNWMPWGDPDSRIWRDADGFITEEQTYIYYFASENLYYTEDRLWMEDEQGYELTHFEFAESGELIFEGVRYADGSGDYTWKDLQGRVTATEKYYANGVQESGSTYEFYENSDICSHEIDTEWDENGNLTYYGEAEYFTDGSLKKSYYLYKDREACWEYNFAGSLIHYTCKEYGTLICQEDYIYNSDNVLLKEDFQAWNPDGSRDFRETNEYYLNGNKSSHIYIYSDGSAEQREYDESGRWTLVREVRASGIVESIRDRDPDNGRERLREYYADGFLKRDTEWVSNVLRSHITYYENHALHWKETANADGTGQKKEYAETGKLVWEEIRTKDWYLECSYTDGRKTFQRYTEPGGKFISQTKWTYYTQNGEKMIRIDTTHSDGSTESQTVKDNGTTGYPTEP